MSIVEALASPSGAHTSNVSRAIAQKYYERTRSRLASALTAKGEILSAAQLNDRLVPRCSAWRPEVGLAQTALALGRMEQAALQLAVISAHDDFSLCLFVEEPSVLVLDGWIVPVQGTTTVAAAGVELRVESSVGSAQFTCRGGCMTNPTSDASRFWDVSKINCHQPRYAIESRLGFSAGNFPWPTTFHTVAHSGQNDAGTKGAIGALARAMTLLAEASPTYMDWIGCVVDGCLLATGPANYGISSPDFPGLVALSSSGSELDYVEAIGAEACHQYLFQLLLVSPLTAPGIEEIHFVPARRFYLTTRRALIAAHVNANVIMMLTHLARQPEYSADARLRIARRRLMLDTDCFPALERSGELSDVGRELYVRIKELVI